MNRINELFSRKQKNILSVYFTAGYPELNSTVEIIKNLQNEGVDLIEIGIPFSDPMADGTVIQQSSQAALDNGMTLPLLFQQLQNIRKEVNIPLILMGYLNPVMQYGVEKFCKKCSEIGIDGIILPDLPLPEYINEFQKYFNQNNLINIFLATPQTSDDRLIAFDAASKGFLYLVSSYATTGSSQQIADYQIDYFKRVQALKLKSSCLIGFGISNHSTFTEACQYANGAIIGSAFIKALSEGKNIQTTIKEFVEKILRP